MKCNNKIKLYYDLSRDKDISDILTRLEYPLDLIKESLNIDTNELKDIFSRIFLNENIEYSNDRLNTAFKIADMKNKIEYNYNIITNELYYRKNSNIDNTKDAIFILITYKEKHNIDKVTIIRSNDYIFKDIVFFILKYL